MKILQGTLASVLAGALLACCAAAYGTTVCEVQDFDPDTGLSPLDGQSVVLTGVVTVPPGVFQKQYTSMYIRGIGDDICGLNVFSYERIGNIALGDTVAVTGLVEEYVSSSGYGASTEITFASQANIAVRPGDPVVLPEEMTTGQVNHERYEGRLVRVAGRLVSPVLGRSFTMDDGTGPIQIYDFGGNFETDSTWLGLGFGDEVTVTGVVSQSDQDAPYLSGYRIFPRSPHAPFGDVATPQCIPGGSPHAALSLSDYIFAPETGEKVRIRYNGPNAGRIKLRIYDACGRCVATLDDRVSLCGETEVVWDGRNELMELLPMGLYHIVVTAAGADGGSETQETLPLVIGRRLK